MKSKEIPVISPNGEEGVIESLTISELDYLMVKVRYNGKWINYSVGKIDEVLNLNGIKFKNINWDTISDKDIIENIIFPVNKFYIKNI